MSEVSVSRKADLLKGLVELDKLLECSHNVIFGAVLGRHNDLDVVFKVDQNEEFKLILHEYAPANRIVIIDSSSIM